MGKPDPNKEFSEPVNAIFWEDVSPYLDPELDVVYQAFAEGKADEDPIMGSTLRYVKEKHIPLFLGDLSFNNRVVSSELISKGISVLEVFTGSAAAFSGTEPIQKESRRRFLARGLGLGVAAWGATHPALHALSHEGGRKNLQDLDVQARRDVEAILANKAHPELYLELLRNALWAKKLFFISEELRRRGVNHPGIGIVAGFGHRYLDYFLRHPNEIDGVTLMYKDAMERFVISKKYVYGLLELNFHDGSYSKQFREVPELQRIYKEKESTSLESKG